VINLSVTQAQQLPPLWHIVQMDDNFERQQLEDFRPYGSRQSQISSSHTISDWLKQSVRHITSHSEAFGNKCSYSLRSGYTKYSSV